MYLLAYIKTVFASNCSRFSKYYSPFQIITVSEKFNRVLQCYGCWKYDDYFCQVSMSLKGISIPKGKNLLPHEEIHSCKSRFFSKHFHRKLD